MKDERFEKIREGIYQELLKANQHFKIYWGIRLSSKDIAKVMNVYLTFFYYTMWGNNDRFCLGIYNVVKPDPDTANFTKLFNHIKSNKDLSKIFDLKEINKMEAIIQSHESLIKRIKVIRDQYIAHNQLEKKHLQEETTYTYEEGKKLLQDLNTILSDLSRKYDGSGYWSDTSNLLDVNPSLNVEDMLRHLTEHRSESIKRRGQEHHLD
jgi:hypothetical protein